MSASIFMSTHKDLVSNTKWLAINAEHSTEENDHMANAVLELVHGMLLRKEGESSGKGKEKVKE